VEAASKKAQTVITNEFIKDANYYCREDTSMLIKSSLQASKPEEGLAVWDTKYARKVYYTGFPSKDVNPNASTLWGEKAKKQHKDKYKKMGQKIAKELI
jgi:hypothetical protein